MRQLVYLPAVLFFLAACSNGDGSRESAAADTTEQKQQLSQSAVTDHTTASDPLTDTLMKLPFIQKSQQYIDSFSNHQHGIAFIVDTTETGTRIKAGYNGDERFETYYDLLIDNKTREIRVLDPVDGEYIPLQDYLKNH